MKSTKILALVLVVMMCVTMLASCGIFGKKCDGHVDANDDLKCDKCGADHDDGPEQEDDDNKPVLPKTYTYNTYTALSPSNWNELTYQDSNDTQILSYISSSFFSYDFKYDEYGEIVPGAYVMKHEAVTDIEDVSASVDAKWNVPEGKTGYAYKFTFRNDLKWENGDPITAHDFVYSMQEQLNPLFQNYRADSYYNSSTVIIGAKDYVKQGQSGWFRATDVYSTYSTDIDSLLVFSIEGSVEGSPISYYRNWLEKNYGDYIADGWTGAQLTKALGIASDAAAVAALEGKTLAEIKADETLAATWAQVIGAWQTEPNEELHFFIANYEFPAYSWENVGFYAVSDYELVMVLEKALPLLDENGGLTYRVAYNLASLPLVHKATYEANKVPPTEGTDLWTTTYNTSKASTMSWGPYKLADFQAGKQYTLVKNENWFGYGLEENEGLYQTDKIVCDTIEEWSSAWAKFLAGEIDGIGIDVTIADDYKGSDRAYFTPDDFIASAQLQSDKDQLKARETEGINKTLLAYTDFRKALSLSINRADFAAKTTTSSLAGFGIFNSMHYLDVENGIPYRETDEAKQVLCDIYGVDVSKYPSLDDAVDSITGYNLELARELVEKAYAEALAAGDIKETDKVEILMGSGAINEVVTRRFNYVRDAWIELVKGTSLEGRLVFPDYYDGGDNWAKDFRAGKYDLCMGGWSGAAWDPGYFLLAYLDPGYMYSTAWDTSSVLMTFTMKGVGEDGADIEETMTLLEWYACLNGTTGAKYDWSSNALAESQRAQLIAALEKEVLGVYYTIPLYNSFGASLISYKVDYITYEYNTFMGYGGMKYMTFNYDDAAWAAAVAEQNGQLNYK